MYSSPIIPLHSGVDAADLLKEWPDFKPKLAIVLGSGWGAVAERFEKIGAMSYGRLRSLGVPRVVGHTGKLVLAKHGALELLIFLGRRHYYECISATNIVAPVCIAKSLRCNAVLLTNAAGGIREDLMVGDLMVIEDHLSDIPSPLIGGPFFDDMPQFPDMSAVYDTELRALLEQAGETAGKPLKSGIYLAKQGPKYETPAEIREARSRGADAVGMSTVPEAEMAHARGMKVVGVSCISNAAAGLGDGPLSHKEVTATLDREMPTISQVIFNFVDLLAKAQVA